MGRTADLRLARLGGEAAAAGLTVNVGSPGRFWTFELARELERAGCLGRLYTAHPRSDVREVSRARVRSYPWLMVPRVAAARAGWRGLARRLDRPAMATYVRWLGRRLEPCSVFHCLSSFGVEGHRTAKERWGAATVCDRGSTHIDYQDDLLREEHERWGVRYRGIDPWVAERELAEYESCDAIFVPSTFARRSFVERGVPEGKLRTIPFGVSLETFGRQPKEDAAFRVLYVGTIDLRKGVGYLLAAAEALARLPGFELWLIGPVAREARGVLAKHEGRFRHVGRVPQGELARRYSQGSVFVLPSVEDGFGMVMSQAMACGLPVVATTHTGARDLFDDGVEGFIVPPRSPEAIAEKILLLHREPERLRGMSAAAEARARALAGWGGYACGVMRAYRELVGKGHADPAD